MGFDLTPPLPTGRYTRLSNAASEASAPNSSPCGRFSVDADVKKSQSFFPRVTAMAHNTFRHLFLRPALNDSQRANLDAYKRFRKNERNIRKRNIARLPEYFKEIELSTLKARSLHSKFHRELDDKLESFADALRKTRHDNPELDFPDALCSTYTSIHQSTTDALLENPRVYPKGYADILTGLLQPTLLELRRAIAPRENVAQLSRKYQLEFTNIRLAIFDQAFGGFEKEFSEAGQGQHWPRGSVETLRSVYVNNFKARLAAHISNNVSMDDLRRMSRNAMFQATETAVELEVDMEGADFSRKDIFRKIAAEGSRYISAEIENHFARLATRRRV